MAVSMTRRAHVHHAQADCSDNTFKFLTAGHIGRDTEIMRLTVHSFMFGILRNSQSSVADSATGSHVWTSHLFPDLVDSVIAIVTHSAEVVQIKKGRRVSMWHGNMCNPEFGLPEGGKDDAENPGSVRSLSLAFIPEPADDGVTSDSVRTEPANY